MTLRPLAIACAIVLAGLAAARAAESTQCGTIGGKSTCRDRCSDLLINIPVGTDIKRNMHNYIRHTDAAAPLTAYLGCDSWKGLQMNSPANFCRGLIQIYQSQLHKLGYTFVGNIQQVTTPRNLPLYYLLFASKHQLGEKFWNETLRRVNAPELF